VDISSRFIYFYEEADLVQDGRPRASCFKIIMLVKSNSNHANERAVDEDLPGSNGVQNS
jgi:hypothetical protein